MCLSPVFGDFCICICNVNKFVGELGLRDARLEVFVRQVTRTCLPTLCLVECGLLRPNLVYLHPGLLKSTPSLLFSGNLSATAEDMRFEIFVFY